MVESAGEMRNLSLTSLRPDWGNPRFPPNAVDSFSTDVDVYAYLDRQFDAASIAESIARHGFFLSEPLIAIPTEDPDSFIVVEGNRRLAALQALASPAVRGKMTDPRWRGIDANPGVPERIPVLVAPDRESVAPILGYRHVTGIAPWDPYQQARYVASLIDDDDSTLTAADVAELIGRDVSEVRAFYRNYSIVEQARDIFDLPDTERIVDEFGVWTRAMTSTGVRDYISAPAPRDVVERQYPLPQDSKEALDQLTTWIFGAPRSETVGGDDPEPRGGRVITDSRQLTRLGRVLSSERGVSALTSGEALSEAEKAMLDKATRFVAALGEARAAVGTASKNATGELVVEHIQWIVGIEQSLAELRETS